MDDPGPVTLGWLLRTWRVEVTGLPAAQVAASLGVVRSAVANWESGTRTPSSIVLAGLDSLYGAGGALRGLAAAVTTPQAIIPRSEWWYNFSGGGPVWAWVRVPAGTSRFRVAFRWGPLGLRLTPVATNRGVLVTLPASVANPGVQARLDPPGWIDHGTGRIPRALGIPVVNALRRTRLADPADHAVAIVADLLRPALNRDGRWVDKLKVLLGQRPDLVEEALTLPTGPHRLADLTEFAPDAAAGLAATWSGEQYRQVRWARGLSQAEAAEAVTALDPQLPVSDDQLVLFEQGGHPRVPLLAARLDMAYRLDGYSVIAPLPVTPAGEGTSSLAVPPWWRGPVWIRLDGPPGAPGAVVLQWPPWERRLLVRPATTATIRAAGQPEPLMIRLPPQWTVTAGLGFDPRAADVNLGWQAIDAQHARDIFNRYYGTYLELFHKTRRDLFRLVQQEIRPDGRANEAGPA